MTTPAHDPAPAAPDLPADPLRAAVAVMDRLYSPGGCPWDREQTHESLVRYLLEESHELAEAIETGDRAGTREELGDVLLQVLFHARIAADEPQPFTVDDVASDLVAKLVRRHPHVFAGTAVGDVHAQWEAIKREEKGRTSVLEGIPLAQGALARAQKVVSRARRAGIDASSAGEEGAAPSAAKGVVGLAGAARGTSGADGSPSADGAASEQHLTAVVQLGGELLDLVRRADAAGIDAEGALRHVLRGLEAVVVEGEGTTPQ